MTLVWSAEETTLHISVLEVKVVRLVLDVFKHRGVEDVVLISYSTTFVVVYSISRCTS